MDMLVATPANAMNAIRAASKPKGFLSLILTTVNLHRARAVSCSVFAILLLASGWLRAGPIAASVPSGGAAERGNAVVCPAHGYDSGPLVPCGPERGTATKDESPGEARRLSDPVASEAKAYTPAVGSPERVAIADAMRAHVRKGHGDRNLPKFLFKIEYLRVQGNCAGFEGFPVQPDGSPFPDGIFDDVVHTTLLVKENGAWRVVLDLSRTDVPTAEEVREIKARVPSGFQRGAIPPYWRELLKP